MIITWRQVLKIKINNFKLTIKITTFFTILLMIALGCLEQFFILYFFIIVHELIHIITAGMFGKKSRGVTVMPIGLCSEIEGIEDMRLIKKNIILLSAPVFNIATGILLHGSFEGWVNVLIGIFNLLPLYPLDGAVLFQNTAGYFIGTLKANKSLGILNKIIFYILFLLGLLQVILFDFNLTIITAAIYIHKFEKRFVIKRAYYFYKCLVNNRKKEPVKVRIWFVNENIILKNVLYKLGMDYYTILWTGNRLIDENMIKKFISQYGINAVLKEIVK